MSKRLQPLPLQREERKKIRLEGNDSPEQPSPSTREERCNVAGPQEPLQARQEFSVAKISSFKKPELGLNVDYYPKFFSAPQARTYFSELERDLKVFLDASQNEVKVFGKVHKVPRKQAAFGDLGLVYEFSGVRVPANPWIPILEKFRDQLSTLLGEKFNFVLVNRYKDGSDHMGEHQDNEPDLIPTAAIAALSFGQRRDLVFRHKDARGAKCRRKDIEPVKISLEHGSLLVMHYPTNVNWYHALPIRKLAAGPRTSLTYRVLKLK